MQQILPVGNQSVDLNETSQLNCLASMLLTARATVCLALVTLSNRMFVSWPADRAEKKLLFC